ncbi:uncharacterized protein ISCGN_009037 [Ixodes scapularis]
MCIRKKFVFMHLSSPAIPWTTEKKIYRTCWDSTSQRILEIRNASDRLWILLLGTDFRRYKDFQHWSNVRKAHFNRLWGARRRRVLYSIKRQNAHCIRLGNLLH